MGEKWLDTEVIENLQDVTLCGGSKSPKLCSLEIYKSCSFSLGLCRTCQQFDIEYPKQNFYCIFRGWRNLFCIMYQNIISHTSGLVSFTENKNKLISRWNNFVIRFGKPYSKQTFGYS